MAPDFSPLWLLGHRWTGCGEVCRQRELMESGGAIPGRMEDSGAKFTSMVEMAERGSGGTGIGALGAWP